MVNPMAQPDPTKVVGRRVLAVVLDALIILVPTFLLITARFEYYDVADLGGQSGEQFCDSYIDDGGACVELDDRVYFSDDTYLGAQGYWLLSSVLILVVLQGLTGWTPGKLLTGIRVRRESGGPPGIGKAALRWILWIADGFPYVIPGLTGFIVALTTPGHRRIGDMAASTFVVKRAAVHTPLSIEEGGRLVVGEQAVTVVPAWAPPPTAPGAPTGWGPAADPNAAGWASSAPDASAAPAPAPPVAPIAPAPAPATEGPQWDEARGTYIQWDPTQGKWMQWDEGFKAWTPIPGQ